MYYCKIKNYDIANGPGVRVSLFVSGCTKYCPGCFQPETWDFEYGEPFEDNTKTQILEMMKPDYISGLTLLGGDPLEPQNQKDVTDLLEVFRTFYNNNGMFTKKTIWAYTGFYFEDLFMETHRSHTEYTERLLSLIDVVVDGPFIERQKDISLRFRGSSNQRIIDVQKSFQKDEIVLWEGD